MRFAIDTGGTFTDLIIEDDQGRLQIFKAPTTPDNPVEGVVAAITLAARNREVEVETLLGSVELLIHGTTISTNAVLTGKTARTGFLSTLGHPDVLVLREAGRMGLPTFDYSIPYPAPYVARALTFEVPERIGADGEIVTPLDEKAVRDIIAQLREKAVEAVGVCLLWSIANPVHEERIGKLLERELPGVPYTLSHRVNPSLREYRRASSTCIDASLKPLMSTYLGRLQEHLQRRGFRGRLLVVTSQGGVSEASALADTPVHSIKSGPAMAPVAGHHYASRELQSDTAIIADTGGTSYDVSLVRRGRIPRTRETWIGTPYLGHMTGFPSVDVRSIGAGGGSIAWVDEGGLLHVGPDSAGSVPGPACYAQGGDRATVTDAALVLGYLDPEHFLGGQMVIESEEAERALQRDVAAPLNLDLHRAASAVLRVATENMVGAIEDVTINQGIDPRGAVLVGGGGAAGLNAVAIARRLGCRKVVIPDTGAALSAAGGLLSDLSTDVAALFVTNCSSFDFDCVNRVLADLGDKCRAFVEGPGTRALDHRIEFFVEARYAHQIWEIEVPLRTGRFTRQAEVEQLREDFHATHREIFAIDDRDSEVELIAWRTRVHCRLRETGLDSLSIAPDDGRIGESRSVFFEDVGLVDTRTVHVESMPAEDVLQGPAIVESPFTTVVIHPGASVHRSPSGSLIIVP